LRFVSVSNLYPKLQSAIVLVNTVTPSDRRGALEIQLCAVVVG